MEIINATVGKVGNVISGPKQYLNHLIQLGEVAICIGKDDKNPQKPFVWLIGGIEPAIDYLSMARSTGDLETEAVETMLSALDKAKLRKPLSANGRLAAILGFTESELEELLAGAQVAVSAPVAGVKDFTSGKPEWHSKLPHKQ